MGAGVERGAERHSQLRNLCLPSGAARPPSPPPDLPGAGRLNSTLPANLATSTVPGTDLLGFLRPDPAKGIPRIAANCPPPLQPSSGSPPPLGLPGAKGSVSAAAGK